VFVKIVVVSIVPGEELEGATDAVNRTDFFLLFLLDLEDVDEGKPCFEALDKPVKALGACCVDSNPYWLRQSRCMRKGHMKTNQSLI
jgi:hypothetical protein